MLVKNMQQHDKHPWKLNTKFKQDSISVGCVPPTCQLYLFWWPPLDVSGGRVSQVGCIPEGRVSQGVGVSQGIGYPRR